MIAPNSQPDKSLATWQQAFVVILPEIETRLRVAFRSFDRQRRDEFIQDGIVHCLLAFVRLCERGRADSIKPASLVWYAVLHIKSGRETGCRMNAGEPLSRYAQLRNRISVQPLSSYSASSGKWIDMLVEGKRGSVADQVASRLDIRAWLAKLPQRTRLIAKALALGCSTAEVARKFGVSPGRISQLRGELESSWAVFQQGRASATATNVPAAQEDCKRRQRHDHQLDHQHEHTELLDGACQV